MIDTIIDQQICKKSAARALSEYPRRMVKADARSDLGRRQRVL